MDVLSPPAASLSDATTVNETVAVGSGAAPVVSSTNDSTILISNGKPATSVAPSSATDDELLFSPSLISSEIVSLLPEGYTARPLRRSDYYLGYLDVLRVLTTVGDISFEQWNERYDFMLRRNDEYYLLVICDETGRIVGTGSLIVERKFIHALGMVGHIEDIAVSKDQQGKKLGLRIIQALDHVAAKVGCYKVCIGYNSSKTFRSQG
jgi:glucosamine-phosphate N-acetyltransferase